MDSIRPDDTKLCAEAAAGGLEVSVVPLLVQEERLLEKPLKDVPGVGAV